MNEIRFNAQKREPDIQKHEVVKEKKEVKVTRSPLVSFLKICVLIIIFVALLFGLFFGFKHFKNKNLFYTESDAYSAVFLNNGQTFFGKIISLTPKDLIMEEVFYLQMTDNVGNLEQVDDLGAENQSRFNLVKLGTELHGPEDRMYINREQVLYRVYLRGDSAVVEAIRNYR